MKRDPCTRCVVEGEKKGGEWKKKRKNILWVNESLYVIIPVVDFHSLN